jgi:protein-S-isoprenylcysteine O-methyltransferase Ste14
MEMAITVMMALGIFVGIPAMIGLMTAGWFVYKEIRLRKEHLVQNADQTVEFEKAV